jgi:hypothetical protein
VTQAYLPRKSSRRRRHEFSVELPEPPVTTTGGGSVALASSPRGLHGHVRAFTHLRGRGRGASDSGTTSVRCSLLMDEDRDLVVPLSLGLRRWRRRGANVPELRIFIGAPNRAHAMGVPGRLARSSQRRHLRTETTLRIAELATDLSRRPDDPPTITSLTEGQSGEGPITVQLRHATFFEAAHHTVKITVASGQRPVAALAPVCCPVLRPRAGRGPLPHRAGSPSWTGGRLDGWTPASPAARNVSKEEM